MESDDNILRCLLNIHHIYNVIEVQMTIISRLIQVEPTAVRGALGVIRHDRSNEMVSERLMGKFMCPLELTSDVQTNNVILELKLR